MVTAYQSLYRKYRSQTFADLVGQEATLRALQAAIAADRVAHAYLFSGSRGTGKTSTARLLAKAVNCLQRAPGTAEPCNRCESCLQVQNGSALDLIEIDAASNRGIDEIRDLREKVNLAPALGRKKVYIIDEAHMLTTEAFNALLKTLEEPPGHVVFVLCTTEANKVPATVLGRCQQFVFRRFSEEQVVSRLAHIAASEGIEAEPEALVLIAHVAQGSMRDAIGLMDQLVPLAGAITVAAARDLLGVADPAQIDRLLDQVLAGRAGEALRILGEVYEGGGELRQVVRGLMERTRDRLVRAIDEGDRSARDRLSSILDALLHLDGEVRRHAEPRFLVEAALVRLAVEVASPTPGPAPSQVAPPTSQREAGSASQGPTPPAEPRPPSAPGDGEAGDPLEGWRQILSSLELKTRACFREARAERDGNRLILSFPQRRDWHYRRALEHQGEVEARVRDWLGEEASVELRLLESTSAARGGSRPRTPEEAPVVVAALRKLEGKVVRVRPLKET
ncbi:MAG TPA: DNA polymerase III subunit gamma/tau [Candidatus Dormibacteraeota bacterium]|nr:DNA polymerase III subunit gamma/tau [Candidatus Dormibacteraeota bacterium]